MYIEGDVPYVGNCNNGNNGWNDWSWIIGLAVVGGIFGNGGFGFGGGNRGNCATVQDVASGFSTSEIMSDLNDIILGQSQGFASVQQTLCQGFSGVNSTVTNGFANLNTNLASLAYNTQTGFNQVGNLIQSCCCDTQRAIDGLKFENCQNTSAIINANNANTRAILDFLTSEKISALQAENSGLKAQISNDRQSMYITDTILDRLSPCPKPSYFVPNPNCCYNYGVVPFGTCGASVQ